LLQYYVRKPVAEQIEVRWREAPAHLFDFATSTIYRPKQGILSRPLLGEFVQFYL
jgi:hypothetical protein